MPRCVSTIGGNIGARLAELGQAVYGYDLNRDRVREWSEEAKSQGGSDLAAVDWPSDWPLKDVELLRGDIGALPAADLNDDVEQAILQARALLGPERSPKYA